MIQQQKYTLVSAHFYFIPGLRFKISMLLNGWQEKQIILKEKLQKKWTNADLFTFVHFRHTKKSHAGACKV